MKTEVLGVRVEPELRSALEKYAESVPGSSYSSIMTSALASFLASATKEAKYKAVIDAYVRLKATEKLYLEGKQRMRALMLPMNTLRRIYHLSRQGQATSQTPEAAVRVILDNAKKLMDSYPPYVQLSIKPQMEPILAMDSTKKIETYFCTHRFMVEDKRKGGDKR